METPRERGRGPGHSVGHARLADGTDSTERKGRTAMSYAERFHMKQKQSARKPAPLPPGTKLADEGQTFKVPTLTMVKYGADSRWLYKHVDAHVHCECGNDYFGGDPAEFTKKACFVADGVPV